MSGYHSLDVYIFRQSGDLYRDFYMSYTSPPGVLINYLIKLSSTLVNIEIDVLASNKHGTRNRLQLTIIMYCQSFGIIRRRIQRRMQHLRASHYQEINGNLSHGDLGVGLV